jgi:hypothetical protein
MEGQFSYEDFDLLIEPGPPGSYRAAGTSVVGLLAFHR